MHTANPDPRTSPAVARRPVRHRREDALRPELRIKRAYETRDVRRMASASWWTGFGREA